MPAVRCWLGWLSDWVGTPLSGWGCPLQVHLIDTRAGRENVSPHKFVINTKWQAVKELHKTEWDELIFLRTHPCFPLSPFGCSISQEILLSLIYFSRDLCACWIPPFLLHSLLDLFRLLFQFVWNLFFLCCSLTSLSFLWLLTAENQYQKLNKYVQSKLICKMFHCPHVHVPDHVLNDISMTKKTSSAESVHWEKLRQFYFEVE